MNFVIRKRPYKINVDQAIWDQAEEIAIQRLEDAMKGEFKGVLGNGESLLDTNIRAAAAELAFFKMIGADYQDPGLAGTGQPDCYIGEWSVDIKSTPGLYNDLMLSLVIKHEWDIYVLIPVVGKEIYYTGWTWGSILIRPENIFHPAPKNGRSRSDFYRVLYRDLNFDDFWDPGWKPKEYHYLSHRSDLETDQDQSAWEDQNG